VSWHDATLVLIITIVAVSLIYEVAIVWATGDNDSISWEIWTAAYRRPVIALFVGILIGHWFWQMLPPTDWHPPKPAWRQSSFELRLCSVQSLAGPLD
jgi:hypothetical protein